MHELAIGGETVDPRIAVTVGDIQFAVFRSNNSRGPVERRRAANDARVFFILRLKGPVVAGVGTYTDGTDRHQQFTVRRELADGVLEIIDTIDRVVRTDRNAVGAPTESAAAPGRDEGAIALVDEHLVLFPRVKINAVARVDRNVG